MNVNSVACLACYRSVVEMRSLPIVNLTFSPRQWPAIPGDPKAVAAGLVIGACGTLVIALPLLVIFALPVSVG
jgi:hypothetical protein